MKAKKDSVVENASALAQFINSTGEISKALYLAGHPEEKDEAPRAAVVRNTHRKV
jgi:hypothetical protein